MTDEPRRIPRRPLLVAGVVVVALLGWGAWGQYDRAALASQTQQNTDDFVPTVQVAKAKLEDGPVTFTLPGTVSAFDQATIYARATGYIAERRVDIGSRVKKGDLLFRISAPDLDQQLAQANAQLVQTQAALAQSNAQVDQAKSSTRLANVTNGRTSTLANLGWETRQNADNTRLGLAGSQASQEAAQAAVKVAQANLAAQYATMQRLQQLKDYENVTAPFDGVVTSRNVDAGDLVSADSNGAGNTLLTIAHDNVVRVQINVPQSGAIGIHDGLDAKIYVPELPNRVFTGKVARSAVALAQSSRTMQAEVDVPNADGTLRPGLYVTVEIAIPRTSPGVVIPSEAVLFNGDGLRSMVVGDGGVVHMHDIAIYRDFGTSVEVNKGLAGGDSVVLSPPLTVADGGRVKVQPPAEQQTPNSAKPAPRS
ncbi:efflux RND transporter periplasmic adaptor subunit [Acidisphaera sp. L21]|uniref:efflux RND transporter periplasmic adaptor subunit n=1 Tax=Acidisphaera sp. L21 TaxID=1641851 RepID=UPI00131DF18F|nr:efflux RND transporter periplasmic adaptor subunit [Acidisphaera sp. L21]